MCVCVRVQYVDVLGIWKVAAIQNILSILFYSFEYIKNWKLFLIKKVKYDLVNKYLSIVLTMGQALF